MCASHRFRLMPDAFSGSTALQDGQRHTHMTCWYITQKWLKLPVSKQTENLMKPQAHSDGPPPLGRCASRVLDRLTRRFIWDPEASLKVVTIRNGFIQPNIDRPVCFGYNKTDRVVCFKEVSHVKQEEKNLQSQKRILEAAMAQFGAEGYAGASLNDICNENGISKGLIYHYFEGKDALFLRCVKDCFDELAQYLQEEVSLEQADAETCLQRYFDVRYRFFSENKAYRQIFCDAVLQTPEHLRTEIAQSRQSFDSVNRAFFETILTRLHLRKNVTPEEAIHFFSAFHEFFNSYFQKDLPSGIASDGLMAVHEAQCHKTIDILLYGIAKEEEK